MEKEKEQAKRIMLSFGTALLALGTTGSRMHDKLDDERSSSNGWQSPRL